MNQPIAERNLFTHALLMPIVTIVAGVTAYMVALGTMVNTVLHPIESAKDAAIDELSESFLGVDPGNYNEISTGSIVIAIICVLVIIATVIYFVILWSSVIDDVNTMCAGDAEQPLMAFVGAFLIGALVPFGFIYLWYYLYKTQDKLCRTAQRYGMNLNWSPTAVIIFAILLSVVAYAIIISSFNEMARTYNARLGFATPQGGYDSAGYEDPGYLAGGYGAGQLAAPADGIAGGVATSGTLVCTSGESAGASITMYNGDTVVLGRDPQISNVILRNDKKISRRHCSVTFRNGAFTVTDYSSNGTRLGNGQKVESGKETPLGSQGVIKLSDQTEFRVQAN